MIKPIIINHIENSHTDNTCKSKLYTTCKEYHYKNLAADEYVVVIKRSGLCK